MLPILRTISVGGVFLAITILALALIPPSRTPMQFSSGEPAARGALIDRRAHPEWRQFLMLSALRRADEIERLRDLPAPPSASPEMPVTTAEPLSPLPEAPASKLAGLPASRDEAAPDDETGSVNIAPSATMSIDIGETSSFELPVSPAEEKMPVATAPLVSTTTHDSMPIETPAEPAPAPPSVIAPPLSKVVVLPPARAKPVVVIRKRPVRRAAPKPVVEVEKPAPTPPPFNIFQAFFASLSGKPVAAPAPPAKPIVLRRPRSTAKKTAVR